MTTPITVTQFKTQFACQLLFVPDWVDTVAYDVGDIVYYLPAGKFNGKFFICLVVQPIGSPAPTDGANWQLSLVNQEYITDAAIQKAINMACGAFNQSLCWKTSCNEDEIAFGYMVAHFVQVNASAVGTDSAPNQKLASVSVGNVSESYANVNQVGVDSVLYDYTTTAYGSQYLRMARPKATGSAFSICSFTHP